jgi:UDP-N-acetylmuramoyl-tripeptide--D-alanyl-D-alanine ligase
VLTETLDKIAEVTGGRLSGATGRERVDGEVVIDSRLARPGGLFAALEGEHTDGHDYAADAVRAGAVAVLASRPVGEAAVVVDGGSAGVITALGRLAHAVRNRAEGVTVSAVTGSSGKTSTKDLLAQVLPISGPTVAAPGSYNNDLGVPLTVLQLEPRTRHLVLEMGARGAGHIARLCQVAAPDVGVVLNVGSAHLGEFGSRDAIARAKRELVEALPATGLAVLNADDDLVAAMAKVSAAPVLRFGRAGSAHRARRALGAHGDGAPDVTAERVQLDGDGRASFRLWTPAGSAGVRLQLVGEHHVWNALAASGVAHHVGLGADEIADALSAAVARSRWRMEVHRRSDGVTIINDAYNANPDSVRAALHALVAMGHGRTWAVLGEMLELGDASLAEHAAIGREAARLGVTRVVAVGAGAGAIESGAEHVPDLAVALDLLRSELRPGDTVLVKSSRDAGLRHLGDALVSEPASEAVS